MSRLPAPGGRALLAVAATLLVSSAATAGCAALAGLGDPVQAASDAAGDAVGTPEMEASADVVPAADAVESGPAPGDGGADAADTTPPLDGTSEDGAADADVQPALALSLGVDRVSIVQGSSAQVSVTVLPAGGFSSAVAVSVFNLPPLVTADPLTITPPSLSGTLTLRAASAAPTAIVAEASVSGSGGGEVPLWSPGVPLSVVTQGPSGTPDTTFGTAGIATLVMPTMNVASLAVDSLDRILFCGNAVASNDEDNYDVVAGRLNEDGSVDTTFGSQGGLYWGGQGSCQVVHALSTDAVALVGFTAPTYEMLATLLTVAGEPDPSFASTGTRSISQSNVSAEVAYDALVRPDGRWVLAGLAPYGAPALLSLMPDGTADLSFDPSVLQGIGARTFNPADAGAVQFDRLGLLPNGDILAAVPGNNFVLDAVAPDGVLDTSYGSGGVATIFVSAGLSGGWGGATGIAIAADGTTLCAGSTAGTIELTRLTPAGQVDTTFGDAGRTSTPMAGSLVGGSAWSLVETLEGGAAVGFITGTGASSQVGIVRYDSIGHLDTSFNGTGSVFMPAPSAPGARPVAVDHVGRILIAAGSLNGPNMTIARFWP